MKLKGKTRQGTKYNCPVQDCLYTGSSARNFYDHLKLKHNFMEFIDRP